MSYSFSVQALTKAAALTAVAAKFDEVVNGQPVHAKDRAEAEATVQTFIGLVADPDPAKDQGISISVSGSLSWQTEGVFTGANVSVGAHVAALQAETLEALRQAETPAAETAAEGEAEKQGEDA